MNQLEVSEQSEHSESTQKSLMEQSAISEHSEHQNQSQYYRSLEILRLVKDVNTEDTYGLGRLIGK